MCTPTCGSCHAQLGRYMRLIAGFRRPLLRWGLLSALALLAFPAGGRARLEDPNCAFGWKFSPSAKLHTHPAVSHNLLTRHSCPRRGDAPRSICYSIPSSETRDRNALAMPSVSMRVSGTVTHLSYAFFCLFALAVPLPSCPDLSPELSHLEPLFDDNYQDLPTR